MIHIHIFKCFAGVTKPKRLEVKFRHYEKATKFKKISHLFLLSSVKTSGRFFQIFVGFSEKLNFNSNSSLYLFLSVFVSALNNIRLHPT